MPKAERSLNELLYDIKRIEEHREKLTEKQIRKIYKSLMQDLNNFLANEYFQYANSDGALLYTTLQEKIREARFLEEIVARVDKLAPEVEREILDLVEKTYSNCYKGMEKAVKSAQNTQEIGAIMGDTTIRPEVLKQTFNNNITKLTLMPILQKHRADIIYQIKQTLTVGMINGDRYDEMSRKIAKVVDNNHAKAANIVRTESHRNVESGFMDCARNISTGLDGSGMVYVATWRTMKDERVRPNVRRKTKTGWITTRNRNGADHQKMEGVAIQVGDQFKLEPNVYAECPSMSGTARNDCNCRCFLEYDLLTEGEFNALPNKQRNKKVVQYGHTDTSDAVEGDSLSLNTDENGNLTPERERLHKEIIDKHFANAERPSEQPTFTVMGGGSAAGKSTMIKSGAVTLPKGAVMVDSDAIKAMLPEYQQMISAGNFDTAAPFVHEESSALAKRILSIANQQGYNVVLDGTGDGSVKSLTKKITNARNAGLRVEGIYATVPTETAVERSMSREKKTGRKVPIAAIKYTHKKVSEILPQCAELFDDVRLFDTLSSADLIATGGNGAKLSAVKGKEAKFRDFLQKAKE